jgi:hypothetical protein
MIVYRKSWFAERGANNFLVYVGTVPCARQEAKAAGRPIGQTSASYILVLTQAV